MSYILDALKRAEQKAWRGKTPNSRTIEAAVRPPAWEVKMVSSARYERLNLKTGEGVGPWEEPQGRRETAGADQWTGASDSPAHDAERKESGLPEGAGIAVALLTLLLLIECAIVYDVRARMSAIATNVGKLTRQISETERRIAKTEGQRLNLKLENDSLRRELELAGADLARARDDLRTLKVRQEHVATRKRQATATGPKRSSAGPLAAAPPPPMGYRPPIFERASGLDAVETATITVHSIR